MSLSGWLFACLYDRITANVEAAGLGPAGPAEALPFDDTQFDTVVSTLVLCTVGDQARARGQLRHVLKPGGRLLFIEHVRSDDPRLAAWRYDRC